MGKKYQPQEVTRYTLSTGEIAVLPTESGEDLENIIDELYDRHEPEEGHEEFLVDVMIRARWESARFRRLEAEAFERMLEDQYGAPHADRRLLSKLEQAGNIFDKLQKRAAAAERAYTKAERDLAQYRAKTKKAEQQNEPDSDEVQVEPEVVGAHNSQPITHNPGPRPTTHNSAPDPPPDDMRK